MDEIDDWWRETLLSQMYAIPSAERRQCQWVMNTRTLNLLRRISASDAPFYSGAAGISDHVFGIPVHIDEEADGATLRPCESEAVR